MNFLMIYNVFCGEYQELFETLLSQSYRIEEKNHYSTIIKDNFPHNHPIPYTDLSKNYLSRKYQDRNNCNRPTKICQKGLEKRIENRDSKMKKVQNERKIQQAFSRKIKNETYNKRHHTPWQSNRFRQKEQ